MLYANTSSTAYPRLTESLRKLGVCEETIALVPDFLDPEKPRDLSVLDSVTPQDLTNTRHFREVERAVEKELISKKSDELNERWMLLLHAIGGETAYWFVILPVNQSGLTREQIRELVLHALRARYGEAAEAHYAVMSLYRPSLQSTVSGFASEICPEWNVPDALGMTRQIISRLILCMSVLDTKEVPAKKGLKALFSGREKDADVSRVMEALTEIAQEMRAYRADMFVMNGTRTLFQAAVLSAAQFNEKLMPSVEQMREKPTAAAVVELLARSGLRNKARLLDMLEDGSTLPPDYLRIMANYNGIGNCTIPDYAGRMQKLAGRFPEAFKAQMQEVENAQQAGELGRIYAQVHPEDTSDPARDAVKQRCLETMTACCTDYKDAVWTFLQGGTLGELLKTVPLLYQPPERSLYYDRGDKTDYVSAYGMDEFAERCIVVQALLHWQDEYHFKRVPGFAMQDGRREGKNWVTIHREGEFAEILHRYGMPPLQILTACGAISESYYGEGRKSECRSCMIEACKPYAEEIAAVDPTLLAVPGRLVYAGVLHAAGMEKRLFTLSDESSKQVREVLVQYLPAPGGDCDEEIMALLTAKKAAKRELAASLLERNCPDAFREAVQKAFETEKTAALKARFAAILGEAVPEEAASEVKENLVVSLTKGSKAKKVAWLFENPFPPVRMADGSEAPENHLQALTLAYASMNPPARNTAADSLAAALHQNDLEKFAQAVFGRWLNAGAAAKTKWVLYLAAIHGGMDAQAVLLKYIKEWSENSRGAIACEAVNALAMNGSSAALMAVDQMARKCKKRQVKEAAGQALQAAAEALGLTREELADRIVPDLGFDKQICRVFDFGTRQFKVYLTPALELEIYEGDKKLKNLPKPGAKDDTEKAEAAAKAFKEMKKQMKTAIQTQRQRLEYVLMCDRKWTAAGWRELFIEKPVMHCFAIGLIWGVYKDGSLVQTFRYLEDGSLNTADEEEYELPEDAAVGLVHPLELDAKLLAAWKEQLADYEIVQPFRQLDRPVYLVTEEERQQKELHRFDRREMGAMLLLGRMTGAGWEKGYAQDAGMFFEFYRTDIAGQTRNADGSMTRDGYVTQMDFTGMYIGGYYAEADDVSIEKVTFRRPDAREEDALPLGEVNARYFSEIVLQLTTAIGENLKEETE
ncbi:MAG: DUF4132 domain-containing protein [Oscillospiraceae bacterium]|nr:DUF4132 domain-containing protein [Oscillospiraceae bacterium]